MLLSYYDQDDANASKNCDFFGNYYRNCVANRVTAFVLQDA